MKKGDRVYRAREFGGEVNVEETTVTRVGPSGQTYLAERLLAWGCRERVPAGDCYPTRRAALEAIREARACDLRAAKVRLASVDRALALEPTP